MGFTVYLSSLYIYCSLCFNTCAVLISFLSTRSLFCSLTCLSMTVTSGSIFLWPFSSASYKWMNWFLCSVFQFLGDRIYNMICLTSPQTIFATASWWRWRCSLNRSCQSEVPITWNFAYLSSGKWSLTNIYVWTPNQSNLK